MRKRSRFEIVYYSGTGGTKMVAEEFYRALLDQKCSVELHDISQNTTTRAMPTNPKHDILLVVFPLHAFNAPKPVYQWIESLAPERAASAAVISVSGGGEVSPNTSCRTSVIKKLEQKGFPVAYETMIVMPNNWVVPTPEPLALKLLEVLPARAKTIVDELLSGKTRRSTPLVRDRFISKIGELEKPFARIFGKAIKVSTACSACGLCERHCPARNIQLDKGRPTFGADCHLCLNCIYTCPVKALTPRIARFCIIKEGYNLKLLQEKLPFAEEVNIDELAKGYAWSGVKKYLLG